MWHDIYDQDSSFCVYPVYKYTHISVYEYQHLYICTKASICYGHNSEMCTGIHSIHRYIPVVYINKNTQVYIRYTALHTYVYTPWPVYTGIKSHTPVLSIHCPLWVMWTSKGRDKNSKSRPPHCQCTSGILAVVIAQPNRKQRTHGEPSSSMCAGIVATLLELFSP